MSVINGPIKLPSLARSISLFMLVSGAATSVLAQRALVPTGGAVRSAPAIPGGRSVAPPNGPSSSPVPVPPEVYLQGLSDGAANDNVPAKPEIVKALATKWGVPEPVVREVLQSLKLSAISLLKGGKTGPAYALQRGLVNLAPLAVRDAGVRQILLTGTAVMQISGQNAQNLNGMNELVSQVQAAANDNKVGGVIVPLTSEQINGLVARATNDRFPTTQALRKGVQLCAAGGGR